MTVNKNTQIDKTLDDIRKELYANIGQHQSSGEFPKRISLYDGVLRGIVELTAWGLYQLYKFLNHKLIQAFPHLSSGKDLLKHCESIGVIPKPASKTIGIVIVSRGDTNGNRTISAGQMFKTKVDSQGREYRFVTVEDYVCQDGEANAFPNVEAELPGRAYNVPVGFIKEFVNPIHGFDTVTNDSDWIIAEGHDEESESSLKNRYTLQWKASSGLNDAYYEKIARSVDGVVDVFIDDQHPNDQQAGIEVIIRGEKGVPPKSVVDNVKMAIADRVRQLDIVTVSAVTVKRQPLELHLKLTSGDKDKIVAEVTERLWALNDPLSAMNGISPLQIRQNLTMDTLIVAAKLKEVNKIIWETPKTDVLAEGNLIMIKDVNVTAGFETPSK